MADEYHHRYTYDADNRIVEVETSRDGVLWDKDANYAYYRHGPLARTEIGDLKVQGLDYMYTIQGWIKGVNSNTMNYSRDPGRDGDIALAGNSHEAVGRDAFGYTLGYFQGDYSDIATLAQADRFEAAISGSDLLAARQDLWNGNISHMVTCLPKAADYSASHTITPEAFGSAYTYDQLNRLRSSRVFTNISPTLNQWQAGGGTNPQAFATDYTYDAMGNILTQKRNGAGVAGAPQALDDLTYVYDWKYQNMNIPAEKRDLVSNRLYHVWDQVSSGNYTDDIDHQGGIGTGAGQLDTSTLQTFLATANYGYDELGNLTRDRQEEIAGIEWTVYGKIKKVTRTTGSSKADLEFGYDAGGNRLWKKVTPKGAGAVVKTFYYLRDAQGVEMARYVSYTNTASQLMLVSEEHAIYGSSRLGIDNRKDTLYMAGVYNPSWGGASTVRRELGNKSYELSNHLGNVLVTVTDKKVYKVASGALYYEAEITTINDYYPFGSDIKTRGYSEQKYRFGFNTQEKEPELGKGVTSAEFWVYDGKLGRRWNVDPEYEMKLWISTYHSFSNRPIQNVDPNGALDDNYEIKEDGSISVVRTSDATNTYTFVYEDGTKKDLGTYEKTNGMVKLSENTFFYSQQLYKQGNNYLPGDAAAGVLGAMYSYYKSTGHITKINQLMSSSWHHSGKKVSSTCIDIQYIGHGVPWAVQPDTRNGNVDKTKSDALANEFRKFGFDGLGKWNILSENGNGTDAFLSNSAFYKGHQNHIHIQTFRDSKIKVVTAFQNQEIKAKKEDNDLIRALKAVFGALFGYENNEE